MACPGPGITAIQEGNGERGRRKKTKLGKHQDLGEVCKIPRGKQERGHTGRGEEERRRERDRSGLRKRRGGERRE